MPTVTIGGRVGDTFTGVEDTFIGELAPTTNHGTEDAFFARSPATGERDHSLIRFTGLSNITGPVTVSSISLTINSQGGFDQYTITVRRVLRNWVHNQATWNIYSTGNSWATAGGLGSDTDRVNTSSGSLLHTNPGGDKVWSGAGLIADVQGWINGTFSNHGWMLANDASNDGNSCTLNSIETFSAAERPQLTVIYEVAALAGAGGFLRRKGIRPNPFAPGIAR